MLYPRVSTTDPSAATTYQQYLAANTTYYTEYLVTQLVVEQWDPSNPQGLYGYGNIGQLKVKFECDEYDGTNT